jgi:putative oxidoreductase
MKDFCAPLTALFGRIFLSAIFLFSALGKLMDWSGTTHHMAEKGMVATSFFLAGAIALEIFGGLSVLFGFLTRFGASALVIFLVTATPIFHDFWVEPGAVRMNQMQHFMKNVAIMGGAMAIGALGPGRYSIDAWRQQRRAERTTEQQRHEPVMVG